MKYLIIVVFFLVSTPVSIASAATPIDILNLYISDITPEQSDTVVIRVTEVAQSGQVKLTGGKVVPLMKRVSGDFVGILGIDVSHPIGSQKLTITFDTGAKRTVPIIVKKRKFPARKIIVPSKLAEKGVTARAIAQKISANDRPTITNSTDSISSTAYFSSAFSSPLPLWENVGGYGTMRRSGNTSIRHLGIDLRAATNTPVLAPEAGKVTFSGELPSFGNSVIVDHGLGIYTIFLHFSITKVQTGDTLHEGQEIGLVGSSGEYSLSPHLHFSVRIGGASVDPERFLEATRKLFPENN